MGKITKEEKYLIEQYIKSFDKQIVKVDVEQDSIIYDKSLSMDKKIRELYTSLHHQQHIVFMRISKKTISVLEVAFSILIVIPF